MNPLRRPQTIKIYHSDDGGSTEAYVQIDCVLECSVEQKNDSPVYAQWNSATYQLFAHHLTTSSYTINGFVNSSVWNNWKAMIDAYFIRLVPTIPVDGKKTIPVSISSATITWNTSRTIFYPQIKFVVVE